MKKPSAFAALFLLAMAGSPAAAQTCEAAMAAVLRIGDSVEAIDMNGSRQQVCRDLKALQSQIRDTLNRYGQTAHECGVGKDKIAELRNVIPAKKLRQICG